jgi:hypothetical protein
MVTMIKFSDTIPPQEYEKKRDKVIELLTKIKGGLSHEFIIFSRFFEFR